MAVKLFQNNLLQNFVAVSLVCLSIAQQQQGVVCKARSQVDVVQNHHEGAPLLTAVAHQLFKYAKLEVQVEVVGGFIEKKKARLLGDEGREGNTLAFSP
jgi:hypothetical protein